MSPDVLIEGFLFYKATPQKKATVLKLFSLSETALTDALTTLRARLTGGIVLVESQDEISLATAPALSSTIEALRKNELKADIGKAGAETLAIILYKGPLSRSDIDAIRGVNSSFILRNLMIRGLIERTHNKHRNTYEFSGTTALLSHLGITKRHDLPNFSAIMNTLDTFNAEHNTAAEVVDVEESETDSDTVTL